MSFDSSIGRVLSMFKSHGEPVKVKMKSKSIKPFIAIVASFKFDGIDDTVTFQRVAETIFPDEHEGVKNETWTTYIKNVKEQI